MWSFSDYEASSGDEAEAAAAVTPCCQPLQQQQQKQQQQLPLPPATQPPLPPSQEQQLLPVSVLDRLASQIEQQQRQRQPAGANQRPRQHSQPAQHRQLEQRQQQQMSLPGQLAVPAAGPSPAPGMEVAAAGPSQQPGVPAAELPVAAMQQQASGGLGYCGGTGSSSSSGGGSGGSSRHAPQDDVLLVPVSAAAAAAAAATGWDPRHSDEEGPPLSLMQLMLLQRRQRQQQQGLRQQRSAQQQQPQQQREEQRAKEALAGLSRGLPAAAQGMAMQQQQQQQPVACDPPPAPPQQQAQQEQQRGQQQQHGVGLAGGASTLPPSPQQQQQQRGQQHQSPAAAVPTAAAALAAAAVPAACQPARRPLPLSTAALLRGQQPAAAARKPQLAFQPVVRLGQAKPPPAAATAAAAAAAAGSPVVLPTLWDLLQSVSQQAKPLLAAATAVHAAGAGGASGAARRQRQQQQDQELAAAEEAPSPPPAASAPPPPPCVPAAAAAAAAASVPAAATAEAVDDADLLELPPEAARPLPSALQHWQQRQQQQQQPGRQQRQQGALPQRHGMPQPGAEAGSAAAAAQPLGHPPHVAAPQHQQQYRQQQPQQYQQHGYPQQPQHAGQASPLRVQWQEQQQQQRWRQQQQQAAAPPAVPAAADAVTVRRPQQHVATAVAPARQQQQQQQLNPTSAPVAARAAMAAAAGLTAAAAVAVTGSKAAEHRQAAEAAPAPAAGNEPATAAAAAAAAAVSTALPISHLAGVANGGGAGGSSIPSGSGGCGGGAAAAAQGSLGGSGRRTQGGSRQGGSGSAASPAPTDLAPYLLPEFAAAMRRHCGMSGLYPWQAECLCREGVMQEGRPGVNLVLSAPTGSGKSEVAYVLMLRALIQDPTRKALLALPYVGACREQVARLEPLLKPFAPRKEVKSAYGGHHDKGALGPSCGVLVCTVEAANSMLNRLLEGGSDPAAEFSCVVVDEAHMVGDEGRGHQLEMLLSKLRYKQVMAERQAQQQQQQQQVAAGGDAHGDGEEGGKQGTDGGVEGAAEWGDAAPPPPPMQLVAMSATLPDLPRLAQWLGAACYRAAAEMRPVELLHYLLMPDGEVQDSQQRTLRRLLPATTPAAALAAPKARKGPQAWVSALCKETADQGHQVLMFCATRDGCAAEARQLQALLPDMAEHRRAPLPSRPGPAGADSAGQGGADGGRGSSQQSLAAPLVVSQDSPPTAATADATGADDRATIAAALRALGGEHAAQAVPLAGLIEAGIAYHHKGLSLEARALVEAGFRSGAVSILCATKTLATSVNMPARRVIFRDAYVANARPENWLTPSDYLQMAGRAGRLGLAERGESFLVHAGPGQKPPLSRLLALMRSSGEGEPLASRLLEGEQQGMRWALLEAVVGCGVRSRDDLARFLRCTLAVACTGDPQDGRLPQRVAEAANEAVAWLRRPNGDKGVALVSVDADGLFQPLPLGRAVVASGLPPEDALLLRGDLADARSKGVVLCNDLQPCFLCVPARRKLDMRPEHWQHLYARLQHGSQDAAFSRGVDNIGISMAYVVQRQRQGGAPQKQQQLQQEVAIAPAPGGQQRQQQPEAAAAAAAAKEERQLRLCGRVYMALALQELIAEVPADQVKQQFGMRDVGDLKYDCVKFAGKAAALAERLGWGDMAAVLKQFQARLHAGAKSEILPLTELRGIKLPTARLLYQAGLCSVEDVADAELEAITRALNAGPALRGKSEGEADAIGRDKARLIQRSALQLLLERSEQQRHCEQGWKKKAAAAAAAAGVDSAGAGAERVAAGRKGVAGQRAAAGGKGVAGKAAGAEQQQQAGKGKHAAPSSSKQQQGQRRQQGAEEEDAAAAAASSKKRRLEPPADKELQQQQPQQQQGLPQPPQQQQQQQNVPQQPQREQQQQQQQLLPPPAQQLKQHLEQPRPQSPLPAQLGQQQLPQQQQQQQHAPALLPHEVVPMLRERHAAATTSGPAAGAAASAPAAIGGMSSSGGGGSGGCLPGPGLHLVTGQQVRQLCRQLLLLPAHPPGSGGNSREISSCGSSPDGGPTSSSSSCIGFALHFVPHHCGMPAMADRNAPVLELPGLPRAAKRKRNITTEPQPKKQQQQPSVEEQQEQGECSGLPAGTLLGVAVSWGEGAAAYIPLTTTSSGSGSGSSCVRSSSFNAEAAAELAVLLSGGSSSCGGGRLYRATIAVQKQAGALQQLLDHAPRGSSTSGSSWRQQGALLPPLLVDVRLAAWLLRPECASPHISSAAQQLPALRKLLESVIPGASGAEFAAACAALTTSAAAAAEAAAARPPPLQQQPVPGWLRACRVAAASRTAWQLLLPALLLPHPRLLGVLLGQEMPLAVVLAGMEAVGVGINADTLHTLVRQLSRRRAQLEREVRELVPACKCDLAAPRQVGALLFEHLRLPPPPCATKHRGQRTYLSTDKDVLAALMQGGACHPVVPLIAEHRKVVDTLGDANTRLLFAQKAAQLHAAAQAASGGGVGSGSGGGQGAAVVEASPAAAAASQLGLAAAVPAQDSTAVGGQPVVQQAGADVGAGGGVRIRGRFHHTNSATGRLTMDEPSMQNTPKPHELRMNVTTSSHGGDGGGGGGGGRPQVAVAPAAAAAAGEGEGISASGNHRLLTANVRASFVAAPGCVLLSADYCHFELRLFAHFSGDEALCHMFSEGQRDPHILLATRWRNIPESQVTLEQRADAKAISYGLLYGQGAAALGDAMGVTPKEADERRRAFLQCVPSVQGWMEGAWAECRRTGYVEMLSGRRRWLPEINSSKWEERSAGERRAINTIMQGSAADICKQAMLAIHRRLAALPPGTAALVLQIHDELVVEARQEHMMQVALLLRECMEGAACVPLRVPLRVKVASGPSWGQLQELELPSLPSPAIRATAAGRAS